MVNFLSTFHLSQNLTKQIEWSYNTVNLTNGDIMKFYLMHKDIQAASLNINNETGRIKSVFNISAPEHLPIGVEYAEGKADKYALDEWWEYRCIPNRRTGIEDALKKLKVQNTLALAVRGNALSLTDKYWIKPIAALVRRGIEYVRKLAQCSDSCKLFDDINDDVVKDTAIYYDR